MEEGNGNPPVLLLEWDTTEATCTHAEIKMCTDTTNIKVRCFMEVEITISL